MKGTAAESGSAPAPGGSPPARLADPRAEHPADRLLEESWSTRQREPGHREVVVELLATGLFLAVAVPLALPAFASHAFDWALVGELVALYALFDLRTRRDGGPLVAEGAH